MTEERVGRNAGWALATQLSGAVFTAGLMIFLGRMLSPEEYGYFAFAVSITLLATLFADLGISASAARFMAEHIDDRPAAAHVFRTALRLKFSLAGLVALVLYFLAQPICTLFGSPGATWALRGAALALIGQSIFLLILGGLAALRQQRFGAIITISESAVEVTASVSFVLVGAGAAGATFGRAVGYGVGLGIGLAIAARVIGPSTAGRSPALGRKIVGYAAPLLLVDAAFRAFSAIDVLLISAILGGGAAVAAFELPMRLIVIVGYPAAAAASAVAPQLARRLGNAPDTETFERVLRLLILLQVVFVPPLLIWAQPILELLFGDAYPDAPAVLRALIPFVFLSGVAQPVTLAVNYLGAARSRVPIAVAMLSVNVLVDVLLLNELGVVAAGLGTSAAYLIWVPAHFWILRQRAGLPLRPVLITTTRALLAGVLMSGVLLLIGTGDLALWQMALGAIAGPIVYVIALVVIREVRVSELVTLGTDVAHRLR